ncbi:MAG: alpha/beta fold hydrolase, partial [Variovorax sp.]
MNAQTEKLRLAGAAGVIEALRDVPPPGVHPRGVAVIAHPHPLFGGTMDNKVVQTLARAFVGAGWTAVRFNFRGVGTSEGAHDEGRGETDDMLALVQQVAPEGPLSIAGFSFGAFVAINALQTLWSSREVERVALVGASVARVPPPPLPVDSHERVLVVHGEQDDTVALAAVMDWARPQSLPVT